MSWSKRDSAVSTASRPSSPYWTKGMRCCSIWVRVELIRLRWSSRYGWNARATCPPPGGRSAIRGRGGSPLPRPRTRSAGGGAPPGWSSAAALSAPAGPAGPASAPFRSRTAPAWQRGAPPADGSARKSAEGACRRDSARSSPVGAAPVRRLDRVRSLGYWRRRPPLVITTAGTESHVRTLSPLRGSCGPLLRGSTELGFEPPRAFIEVDPALESEDIAHARPTAAVGDGRGRRARLSTLIGACLIRRIRRIRRAACHRAPA